MDNKLIAFIIADNARPYNCSLLQDVPDNSPSQVNPHLRKWRLERSSSGYISHIGQIFFRGNTNENENETNVVLCRTKTRIIC